MKYRRLRIATPELAIGYYCHYSIRPYGDPPQPRTEIATYKQAYKDKFQTLTKPEQDALFEKVKQYVNEHTYTANQAQRNHTYYGIRVTEMVTDWLPTQRSEKPFTNFMGHLNDRPEPPSTSKDATTRAVNRLSQFSTVKLGFGIARGGRHTYLFSLGNVYEAHWEAPPADTANQNSDPLYQVRRLPDWSSQAGWESGIIVVPGEAALLLSYQQRDRRCRQSQVKSLF